MKLNIDTVKEKFSNFVDRLKLFFSENKKLIMIILPIIIFIIFLLVLLLILLSKQNDNSENYQTKAKIEVQLKTTTGANGLKKLNPNSLWLLDEPLKLPPIQFSREQRRIWKQNEVDYWYEAPSEEVMDDLRQKNKEIIDNLLEAAP